MYEAWGSYVTDVICSSILPTLDSGQDLTNFLKISPVPRLKTEASLIEKAFVRKNYDDKYGEIEDKVGVRFVVLLTTDIAMIEKAIEQNDSWIRSKDRDYEEERRKKPLEFVYQSVHYVVRAAKEITFKDNIIQKGTPCEVQIRTLLQHAYSELTHDRIYKPKATASANVQRAIAKSMALIETTDEFFSQAAKEISNTDTTTKSAARWIEDVYREILNRSPQLDPSSVLILDAFNDCLPSAESVRRFWESEKSFLKDIVVERAERKAIYRQAPIILVYYLINKSASETKKRWPLSDQELHTMYTDLGITFSQV